MRVRVWVDLTNSPHVLVLRPVIERLRAHGRRGQVTARDFAQTLELASATGSTHTVDRPPPRRRARRRKAMGLADRSAALARWARGRAASTSRSATARTTSPSPRALLRIPCSTMFDYEWATVQHNVNCRLAQAVVVPEAIPPERL